MTLLLRRAICRTQWLPSSPLRSVGTPTKRLLQPSICIQCRIRAHSRPSSTHNNPQSPARNDVPPVLPSSPSTPSSTDAPARPPPSSLPSASTSRQSPLSTRFISLMDNAQSYLFSATRHLNDLTGYTSIEALKTRISTLEAHTSDLRSRVRAAKTAYNAAITNRSSSQREVNGLLQRKHAWTPADLERFTALYRSDHANEVEETRAGEELAAAERKADEAQTALGQAILERYHEEQVWSDKIRRMSTWGTWGLMGVNVLLFVVFQVVVEPWRRKRLVKGFEEKVKEAIEGDRGVRGGDGGETTGSREGSVSEALAEEGPVLAEEQVVVPSLSVGTDISPLMELASPPAVGMARYQVALRDLFSDRTISIRKSDVTTIALEGAAAGATFVGVLCYVLTKRG